VSAVVDVGETLELTFSAEPGLAVSVSWLNPDQEAVIDAEPVPENPAGSGQYPATFTPTVAGVWTALFLAPGNPQTYYVRATPVLGPPPLAVIGDVGRQFGPMTPAQEGLAGHLVRAASSLLRQRVPGIDEDVRAGRVDADVAALTVTNMVLRVMRNPNGLRSETTGPFSRTYDTSAAAGQLVVTDYDLAAVTAVEVLADGLASLGVGTIRVVPGLVPQVRRPWEGWRYGRL